MQGRNTSPPAILFYFSETELKGDIPQLRYNHTMKKYTIAFSSITVAMKARSVFRSYDVRTEIIRTPRNLSSGCGYSLVLDGDIEAAINILENKGIKYKAIMERD